MNLKKQKNSIKSFNIEDKKFKRENTKTNFERK
jgi:hypothetical protein